MKLNLQYKTIYYDNITNARKNHKKKVCKTAIGNYQRTTVKV